MGNACSMDSGTRITKPKQHGAARARGPAATANPLTPSSGTTATADPTAADQHTAPLASTQPATGNTVSAETRRAARMAAAHRSVSVAARTDMGYELPEPPLEEHLGRIHPDASLEFSAVLAADAPSVAEAAVRLTQRHRCITVVTGCDRGYELPEPSLAEHLGRIERRAAIAITVHGLTADPRQFTPEAVPAATLARSVERCREWLVETLPLYSSRKTVQ